MAALLPLMEGFKCVSSSTPCNFVRKVSMKRGETRVMSQKDVWYASQTYDSSEDHHHRSLETYFGKLKSESKQVDVSEIDEQSSELQEGLVSLETYFATLKQDFKPETKSEECIPSISGRNAMNVTEDSQAEKLNDGFSKLTYKRAKFYARKKSISTPLYDEKDTANLYLISTLLSINIAVFLFEIASPIKNSDYNLFSLPLLYGAKVNELIMEGEWWRLLTPIFLHSGVFHIGVNSWMLLSFGPQVCKGYGCFTFLLIYILGGVSGNFTSFLHTSDPTVGGSGPVFGVIGAWLIYETKNRGVVTKEVSENMFQKAVVATALSCLLGNFGPIDSWTNVGAAISGIMYGYFTSPVLEVQVDDSTSDGIQDRMKEEMTLLQKPVNSCKSLVIFAVFLSAMSSLLLLTDLALEEMVVEEVLRP